MALDEPVIPSSPHVADGLSALVAYVDRSRRYRFVNRAYEDWFGCSRSELQGRHVRDVLGPESYAAVKRHVDAVLSGREVAFETISPHRRGARRVEVRYTPYFDADGRVRGYYALILDRSALALEHDRDQRLQLALQASGLGDWSWDSASDLVTFSPRAAEIFGIPAGPYMTWSAMQDLLHPNDRSRIRKAVDRAVAERTPYDVEYRIRRPDDGAETWVMARGQALYGEDGAPIGMLGVVGDISRSKSVESELRAERQRLEEVEQSQGLLLRLSDAIRLLDDPRAIMASAAAMLGQHLGVRRVGYGEADEALQRFVIAEDWTDGVASMAGEHQVADFGRDLAEIGRSGVSLVIEDVGVDPRVGPEALAAFERFEVVSTANASLVKGGRLHAVLYVHHDRPRRWTGGEVRLIEEVAERTWSAVERARSERALRESEARFRAMADSAPAPVWVTAAEGPIQFVNQAFADYAGRPREELVGDAWVGLLHPDDLAMVAAARAEARSKFAAYVIEARFRRGDGEYRWMQASSKPRFDGAGGFQGYVGIAVDLTEMRLAEAALRESEQRFRLVAEDAPVMLWMADASGATVYLNRALRDFYGVTEDLTGFDWSSAVHAEDRARSLDALTGAFGRGEGVRGEARWLRADGQERIVFTRAEPRRDAEGRFVGMIGVSVDITEARRAETRQQLLINELNHRVKNTLATVQSLAWQTVREGVEPQAARDALTARLMALSAAHDVLTRGSWEGADLREIMAEALRPYADPARPRVSRRGPAVQLAPSAALALAMAAHELATNATKYGALSAPAGRVEVRWRLAARGDVLHLTWRELGGPPVSPPTVAGFGSRLLGRLADELGGKVDLDYRPDGLRCTIAARLSN